MSCFEDRSEEIGEYDGQPRSGAELILKQELFDAPGVFKEGPMSRKVVTTAATAEAEVPL
jgi:hypothetical protein